MPSLLHFQPAKLPQHARPTQQDILCFVERVKADLNERTISATVVDSVATELHLKLIELGLDTVTLGNVKQYVPCLPLSVDFFVPTLVTDNE